MLHPDNSNNGTFADYGELTSETKAYLRRSDALTPPGGQNEILMSDVRMMLGRLLLTHATCNFNQLWHANACFQPQLFTGLVVAYLCEVALSLGPVAYNIDSVVKSQFFPYVRVSRP